MSEILRTARARWEREDLKGKVEELEAENKRLRERTPEELVEHIRNLPPREICEHGSQRVKCIICENEELERENQRYREVLQRFIDDGYNRELAVDALKGEER